MVRMFTPHKLGCNRQSIGKKCFYFHKITKDQSYLDKCRFFFDETINRSRDSLKYSHGGYDLQCLVKVMWTYRHQRGLSLNKTNQSLLISFWRSLIWCNLLFFRVSNKSCKNLTCTFSVLTCKWLIGIRTQITIISGPVLYAW